MKSYIRNTINFSWDKILLTSVINKVKGLGRIKLTCKYSASSVCTVVWCEPKAVPNFLLLEGLNVGVLQPVHSVCCYVMACENYCRKRTEL
jgi:hypothetical protein